MRSPAPVLGPVRWAAAAPPAGLLPVVLLPAVLPVGGLEAAGLALDRVPRPPAAMPTERQGTPLVGQKTSTPLSYYPGPLTRRRGGSLPQRPIWRWPFPARSISNGREIGKTESRCEHARSCRGGCAVAQPVRCRPRRRRPGARGRAAPATAGRRPDRRGRCRQGIGGHGAGLRAALAWPARRRGGDAARAYGSVRADRDRRGEPPGS